MNTGTLVREGFAAGGIPKTLHHISHVLWACQPEKNQYVFSRAAVNKGPWTGWLIVSWFWEATSPKSRCVREAMRPLRLWVESLLTSSSFLWWLSICGVPWLSAAPLPSLPLYHMTFSVHLSHPYLTPGMLDGGHPSDHIWTWWHLQKPYIQLYSQVPGIRIPIHLSGRHRTWAGAFYALFALWVVTLFQ